MRLTDQFDSLHEAAMTASGGLSDFGAKNYHEPLRLLLSNYEQHGRFSDLGNHFVAETIISNLCARLMSEQGIKDHPQFANARITRPIIIIGMTRTGTTMLHRLIGLDNNLQTLPLWLASLPMPRPPRHTWEAHPAFQKIDQAYQQMYAITPLMRQMHPQSAEAADECRIVLDHSFWSPGALGTSFCSAPEYLDWCLRGNAYFAYQEYKKTLGLIAGGNNNRWLLKDPSHIFALDALIKVFPDACLVFTHRDPVDSFLSFGNLINHSRKISQSCSDHKELSKPLIDAWGAALDKVECVRATIPDTQVLDLYFKDIITDPVGAVQKIYDHFCIEVSDVTAELWRQQSARDPRAGHDGGGKVLTLKDFGLSVHAVRKSVGRYYERYLEVLNHATYR